MIYRWIWRVRRWYVLPSENDCAESSLSSGVIFEFIVRPDLAVLRLFRGKLAEPKHTATGFFSVHASCPPPANSLRIRSMGIEELLKERRDEILRIAARHGAHNVRVFGSVARGEAGPQSDIDLLVDVGSQTSSWFPTGLIDDLEELLGRKVDVITEGGVSPYLREQIYREAVPL